MTKQIPLTEKLAERFEALPEVWFENELFEQTKDYLIRGRRFGSMRTEQLSGEWINSFRQYVRLHVGPHVRDMADVWAEFRLRGNELPTHLVASEMNQLQAAIRWIDPATHYAEFDRKLDELTKNLDNRTNWVVDSKEFWS